jgi:hypothetical protein
LSYPRESASCATMGSATPNPSGCRAEWCGPASSPLQSAPALLETTSADLARIADLVDAYVDLPLGTVDASVTALVERLRSADLPHRHEDVIGEHRAIIDATDATARKPQRRPPREQ